jgi:hypothetical protein
MTDRFEIKVKVILNISCSELFINIFIFSL